VGIFIEFAEEAIQK